MYREMMKKIIVVSDGTGGTAQRLTEAAFAQYDTPTVTYHVAKVFPFVLTIKEARRILREIDTSYMVIFTIVDEKVQSFFHQQLETRRILHLNVMQPVLRKFSQFLGVDPHYKPGMTIKMDDAYMHWIKGIEYTNAHDDGRGERLELAELVLVGPSRSGKTPLSAFIASKFGVWVANIPLFPDDRLVADVLKGFPALKSQKIVALEIAPKELFAHRTERAEHLGRHADEIALSEYHDLPSIQREVIYFRRLYEKMHWPVVETTRRAVEEIAEEVLTKVGYHDIKAVHRT
ncbi:MAG: pyruvate, phosphate dikinase/phosphoenolpyruvate synthase regulator [Patescibacteria group bacterium]